MITLPKHGDSARARSRATTRVVLSIAMAVFLTGCAHVEPFHFRVQDASTDEPLPDFMVYWTESWQKTGATMPFRSRSGFLWSDGTNGVSVVGLRGAVDATYMDNSFRFTAKGYEPLDLSYIPGARTPAVGLFNTQKSPRPLQVYVATNRVIIIPLRKAPANDAHR